jgi:hypothetical protein
MFFPKWLLLISRWFKTFSAQHLNQCMRRKCPEGICNHPQKLACLPEIPVRVYLILISGARKLAHAPRTTDTKWLYRDYKGLCARPRLLHKAENRLETL